MSQNSSNSGAGRPSLWQRLTGNWTPLIEKPEPEEYLRALMHQSALPAFGFYLMLIFAAAIVTLGLLSNSAPTIIGAMIIAPLMYPTITLSYGIVVVDWQLINRSLLMLVSSIILVVGFAFVTTQLFGLRIAGSEILGRTHPTMLDLGVAVCAGGAAAFAYTRRHIMNAIAGVAIAVALLPPLAVCGIGLAESLYDTDGFGYSLSEVGSYSGNKHISLGAALLFVTNLAGIVLTAGIVFAAHGYGQWRGAVLGLSAVALVSVGILHPLGVSLYKLHLKSQILHLAASQKAGFPSLHNAGSRVESVRVSLEGAAVRFNIDLLANQEAASDMGTKVDRFQRKLSRLLRRPVYVEVDLIAVPIRHFSAGRRQQLDEPPR